MSNETQRQFVLVEDPVEAKRLLKDGVTLFASAILWTKDQDYLIHSHLSGFLEEEKSLYAWVPTDFDTRAFEDSIKKVGSDQCYFSVSLPKANVFFKSRYREINVAGIRFDTPAEIFKIQRRRDLRMPIPDGFIVYVEFQDPAIGGVKQKRRLLDISVGGLSFYVAPGEESGFVQGAKLRRMTFKLHSSEVVCDGEIRYVKPTKTHHLNRSIKIGVQFSGIRPSDQAHINTYVQEESRKYFSKLF